ncbi:MAG TPA: hypothetical protein VFZ65_00560 [Planctomycetota bacterium]|nr:hypothetical protein [Planctomycetota bacterium]
MTWEQIVDTLRRLGADPQHAVPVGFAARTTVRLRACLDDPNWLAGAAPTASVAAAVHGRSQEDRRRRYRARLLTGSLLGFVVLFVLIYWLP